MKRADSLLAGVFRELGIEDGVKLGEIRRRWNSLFRKPLPSHMAPALLSRGELLIVVDSPVWLQELRFRQDDILRKLRPFRVEAVRFKLGKVSLNVSSDAQRRALQKKPGILDGGELSLVEDMVSSVDDAELRETIRSAIGKAILAGKTKS